MKRDAMLASRPLAALRAVAKDVGASSTLHEALTPRDSGSTDEARRALRRLVEDTSASSQERLQAWTVLRELGDVPAPTALSPLGVIAEVGLDEGGDLLAVYDDRRACYLNYSGRFLERDGSEASLKGPTDAMLERARALAPQMGTAWRGPGRAPPTRGQVRLNVVTPSGLHLAKDPLSRWASIP